MSDCTHIEEQLVDYLDEALSADERATVEAHLVSCNACRAKEASYREIQDAYRSAPAADVSEGVAAAILSEAARSRSPERSWKPWALLAGVAAVVMFVLWLWEGPERSAIELLEAGGRHLAEGELDSARDALQRGLEVAEEQEQIAALLHRLAEVALAQGEFSEAKDRVDELLTSHPDYSVRNAVAWLRADALLGLGEVGLAIQALERFAAANPDQQEAVAHRIETIEDGLLESHIHDLKALGYMGYGD